MQFYKSTNIRCVVWSFVVQTQMSFDLGHSINQGADYILRAKPAKTIVGNPLYTALLITVIIVFIILWVFREAESDEKVLLAMRAGFWICLTLVVVLFLHNRILTNELRETGAVERYSGVFEKTLGGEEPVKIVPTQSIIQGAMVGGEL